MQPTPGNDRQQPSIGRRAFAGLGVAGTLAAVVAACGGDEKPKQVRPQPPRRTPTTPLGARVFMPERQDIGRAEAAALGSTSVVVRGAGWGPDEHAGKWLEMVDPSTLPTLGYRTVHARRILSNSSDTLALQFGLGKTLPGGVPAAVLEPLHEIVLQNRTLNLSEQGAAAGLIVRYCSSVVLDHVTVRNAGKYESRAGNGISLYHCDKVQATGVVTSHSGNFGMFVYNSDDVLVEDYLARGWGGEFGLQLKDCRSSEIRTSRCLADGQKGNNGYSIKCSGLNPSTDVKVVDSLASLGRQSNFEFSSIMNEGTGFSAEKFSAVRCTSRTAGTNGFSTVLDDLSRPTEWLWDSCDAEQSARQGFANPTSDQQILNCTARDSGFEGIGITRTGVTVTGGLMEDNCQAYDGTGSARSSEILVAASNVTIDGTVFRHTSNGHAVRAVREAGSASNTLVQNCKLEQSGQPYREPFLLPGLGSRELGTTGA